MSIFHKPIQRTFHRVAKNGVVKCNHEVFIVKFKNGDLFNCECTLVFQGRPFAYMRGCPMQKLTFEKVSYIDI